jgi:uncharacterized glyoxalase superfamily protein PhnB
MLYTGARLQPDFDYGNPVVYAGVRSSEVEIYFTEDVEFGRSIKKGNVHPEVFIWIDNADALYKVHLNNGAEIIESITDRPWGARQYVIRDLNGYHLKFAQPI